MDPDLDQRFRQIVPGLADHDINLDPSWATLPGRTQRDPFQLEFLLANAYFQCLRLADRLGIEVRDVRLSTLRP